MHTKTPYKSWNPGPFIVETNFGVHHNATLSVRKTVGNPVIDYSRA